MEKEKNLWNFFYLALFIVVYVIYAKLSIFNPESYVSLFWHGYFIFSIIAIFVNFFYSKQSHITVKSVFYIGLVPIIWGILLIIHLGVPTLITAIFENLHFFDKKRRVMDTNIFSQY